MKTCVASPELAQWVFTPVERQQLRLLRHVLETKTEKVVTQSRFDPLCEGCDSKENCREKAFLGTPVILQDRCVGAIVLIAVTHEQQEHISDNLREFSDYVRHITIRFETSGGSGARR